MQTTKGIQKKMRSERRLNETKGDKDVQKRLNRVEEAYGKIITNKGMKRLVGIN